MEMKFTNIRYHKYHKVRFHATVKQSTYPFLRHKYLLISHLQGNVKISHAPRK